ncbi:MAG TPA: hypothetical protein VKY44_05110 [Flavobacterium sp.]|nr:hypothetical protein [Flavobacterium sp.]
MEQNFCNQIFGNLYNNKIIIRKGTLLFCEFLKCDFNNNILTVQLKVLEPAVKLKIRYKNLYEELKDKEYVELQYNFDGNESHDIEKQQLKRLWANYDFVKKIYELKEQGLEEEIYDAFWK